MSFSRRFESFPGCLDWTSVELYVQEFELCIGVILVCVLLNIYKYRLDIYKCDKVDYEKRAKLKRIVEVEFFRSLNSNLDQLRAYVYAHIKN